MSQIMFVFHTRLSFFSVPRFLRKKQNKKSFCYSFSWVTCLGQRLHSQSWSPETLTSSCLLEAVTLHLVQSPARASQRATSPSFSCQLSLVCSWATINLTHLIGPTTLEVIAIWYCSARQSALSRLEGRVRMRESNPKYWQQKLHLSTVADPSSFFVVSLSLQCLVLEGVNAAS